MPRAIGGHAAVLVFLSVCACVPRTPSPQAPATAPAGAASPAQTPDPELRWLLERSMLAQAATLARRCSGSGELWRRPYARPRPRAAAALASVWFTAYPAATLAAPGESVLRTLGDARLWRTFAELGVRAMHTGPMKRAGGVVGRAFTPTVDGNFDRIGMEIDPVFGTEAEYLALTRTARAAGGIVIGDIIPGHTGKGPDFRLAERGVGDYPGLYHMVEIQPRDWTVLPAVPPGRDTVNLKPAAVDALKSRGYIVGQLPRTIFFEPGVKETDWSATAAVRGPDGRERRWVYLHYFKEGQPTLNWLDPSFAAQRLVLGDALHSLRTLGESMLRLDANGFLGIEVNPAGPAWSEGHPLAVTANQLIGSMVRKLGGFTFQELNLTLDDLRAMSEGGADLSYDFVTRPAVHHALATGDAEFLRLMLRLMHRHRIDPAALIHALQNHDELTLELVHFWTAHRDERFTFRGREVTGSALREVIRAELHEKLLAPRAPYNLRAANGVSCTSASVAAAALGAKDLDRLSDAERGEIQKLHLLLALFNAMQPGVFALSGWDLVGALPLPGSTPALKPLLADGDTRWINRGSYDLLGASGASASAAGLPRAVALYGALPDQLRRPDSFAARLRHLLAVRQRHRIAESEQTSVPEVRARGLVVLVHRLPDRAGLEVTAINFGVQPVVEEVAIPEAQPGQRAIDLLEGSEGGTVTPPGKLPLRLAGRQGRALLLR